MIDVRDGWIRAVLSERATLLPLVYSSPNGHLGRTSYIVSSGSSAGGGGSNLPTRKCSSPVQATITPCPTQLKVIGVLWRETNIHTIWHLNMITPGVVSKAAVY